MLSYKILVTKANVENNLLEVALVQTFPFFLFKILPFNCCLFLRFFCEESFFTFLKFFFPTRFYFFFNLSYLRYCLVLLMPNIFNISRNGITRDYDCILDHITVVIGMVDVLI